MKYFTFFMVSAFLGSTSALLGANAKGVSDRLKVACEVLKQADKGNTSVNAQDTSVNTQDAGRRQRILNCCTAMTSAGGAIGSGLVCVKTAPIVLPVTGGAVVADGVASCMQVANQWGASICGTNPSQTIEDIQKLCRGLSTESVALVRDQMCGVAQSTVDAIKDCGSCAGITAEDVGSLINTIIDPPKTPKRDKGDPVRMKD